MISNKVKKKIIFSLATSFILFFILIITISIVTICVIQISALFANSKRGENFEQENLPGILTYEIIAESIISYEKYNVPAGITLAQIIEESSGNYPIPNGHYSRLAFENKNLFGIKGSGTAGSSSFSTKEEDENGLYKTKASFAKYNSFKESIDHHGRLLKRSYMDRVINKNSSDSWADGLQGKYSTTSNYASNLKSLMKKYNLYRFDGIKLSQLNSILNKNKSKNAFEFGGVDNSLNGIQKRIVYEALKFKDPYNNGYKGYCERFCRHVYENSGLKYNGACCASNSREKNAKKGGKLPIGAVIYSSPDYKSGVKCSCGRDAGHVAIYAGEGFVLGSQPPFKMPLAKFVNFYGYGGFSFHGNDVK